MAQRVEWMEYCLPPCLQKRGPMGAGLGLHFPIGFQVRGATQRRCTPFAQRVEWMEYCLPPCLQKRDCAAAEVEHNITQARPAMVQHRPAISYSCS